MRGHIGDIFYLKMRRPLSDFNALLSSHSGGGLTVAPNWQGGACFSIQLNGKLTNIQLMR